MLRIAVVLVLGVLAQQTFADEPEAIVGGTAAGQGEFPHQCSLRYGGSHMCGCSILSNNKVLTAAHCVYDVQNHVSRLTIATGSIDKYLGNDHSVKYMRIHRQYAPGVATSWNNDIAVLTLKGAIRFDRFQQPISLASSPPIPGTQCTLSGWGMTRANGPSPQYLLKMSTRLVDTQSCSNQIGARLTGSHLCAFDRSGTGGCQGDSGGPLICNGIQSGLISFVFPCGVGAPDVYTSIYNHRNFIDNCVNEP